MNSARIRIETGTNFEITSPRQAATGLALGRLALIAHGAADKEFKRYGDALEADTITYAELKQFVFVAHPEEKYMASRAFGQFYEHFIQRHELIDAPLEDVRDRMAFPTSWIAAALLSDNITGPKSKQILQDYLNTRITELRSQA